MRLCTVSVMGNDGEEHALQAEASSLMHAAYAGVEAWAKSGGWPSDGVLEVRSAVEVWRVKASRANAWYDDGFEPVVRTWVIGSNGAAGSF